MHKPLHTHSYGTRHTRASQTHHDQVTLVTPHPGGSPTPSTPTTFQLQQHNCFFNIFIYYFVVFVGVGDPVCACHIPACNRPHAGYLHANHVTQLANGAPCCPGLPRDDGNWKPPGYQSGEGGGRPRGFLFCSPEAGGVRDAQGRQGRQITLYNFLWRD